MAADVLRSKCARARGTLYLLSPECIALYDNLDAFFVLAGISRPYRKLHEAISNLFLPLLHQWDRKTDQI